MSSSKLWATGAWKSKPRARSYSGGFALFGDLVGDSMVEGKPSTCFRLVFTLRFQQCKYEPVREGSLWIPPNHRRPNAGICIDAVPPWERACSRFRRRDLPAKTRRFHRWQARLPYSPSLLRDSPRLDDEPPPTGHLFHFYHASDPTPTVPAPHRKTPPRSRRH